MIFNKKHIVYLVILLSIVAGSCENYSLDIVSVKYRLTKHIWKMKSFSDYKENVNYMVSQSTYKFAENGTIIIMPEKAKAPIYSKWELFDNEEYLKIGNNSFKITYISDKLLGLRYGNLMIYYIPVN